MSRIPPISEASMQAGEARIPELAAQAGHAAHQRALAQAGAVLMRSASGMLVEQSAGGTQRIIRPLPAGTPVRVGAVLLRRSKKLNDDDDAVAAGKPLAASGGARR